MQEKGGNVCQRERTPYKIASCYLGHLTKKFQEYFTCHEYVSRTVGGSLTKAIYIFIKRGKIAKVIQLLNPADDSALLQIEVEGDELAGVEALLKSENVPKACIDLEWFLKL